MCACDVHLWSCSLARTHWNLSELFANTPQLGGSNHTLWISVRFPFCSDIFCPVSLSLKGHSELKPPDLCNTAGNSKAGAAELQTLCEHHSSQNSFVFIQAYWGTWRRILCSGLHISSQLKRLQNNKSFCYFSVIYTLVGLWEGLRQSWNLLGFSLDRFPFCGRDVFILFIIFSCTTEK